MLETYIVDSRKIGAREYWDDRAVLVKEEVSGFKFITKSILDPLFYVSVGLLLQYLFSRVGW